LPRFKHLQKKFYVNTFYQIMCNLFERKKLTIKAEIIMVPLRDTQSVRNVIFGILWR